MYRVQDEALDTETASTSGEESTKRLVCFVWVLSVFTFQSPIHPSFFLKIFLYVFSPRLYCLGDQLQTDPTPVSDGQIVFEKVSKLVKQSLELEVWR